MALTQGNAYLQLDVSEVMSAVELMRASLNEKQFQSLMRRTIGETARKAKSLTAREVVKDYCETQGWVASAFRSYKMSAGAGGINCVIPISWHKGTIGGRYSASGGRNGRPIKARIVRTNISVLPGSMSAQGGNPPFINGNGGVAMTRRTKARLPIVRVVGLAVPQMPVTRSRARVENTLVDYMGKRLDHNFAYMFGR